MSAGQLGAEAQTQDKLTDFRKVSKNGNTPMKNQFPKNPYSFDKKVLIYFTENVKPKL